jgi:hypothetical protein
LIHVETRYGTAQQAYAFSSINFAFISSPTHNRRQASAFMTCREHFNRTFWNFMNKEKGYHYDPATDPPIDTEKLRLLILFTPQDEKVEQFKSKLFNGKACMNILEKINGWKPSTISTVKHSMFKHAWMLTGPREWLFQPQLLSLATWVIRLSAVHGPIVANSFTEYELALKKIAENPPTSNNNADSTSYVRSFWNKIYVLLKYHNEIWKDMNFKKGWCIKTDKNFGVQSGLSTFINRQIEYSKDVRNAADRFNDLCKEYITQKK